MTRIILALLFLLSDLAYADKIFTPLPPENFIPTYANAAALPLIGNIDGATAITLDNHALYIWDDGGSTWNLQSGSTGVGGPGVSVNNEIMLWSGVGGDTAKRATGTGIVKATAGVYSVGNVEIAEGGTGATTASGARTSLGAAASGANSDITSLTALSTPLSIAQGGTSASTAAGARSALGISIGTNVQPYDDTLTALAATTDDGFLAHTGVDTFESREILGTSNRITVTDGDGISDNPEINIAATYVGQTSLTTLGTITTGTWQGTAIGAPYQTTFVGDSGAGGTKGAVPAPAAGDAAASKYLKADGTWATIPPGAGNVDSVNGQTGVVVLDTDDIAEATAVYHTTERAQDAAGAAVTDTASVDFTYNDGANTISAAVLPAGVDKNALGGAVLTTANGGTGQNSTATFPTSGVVVTEGGTQTLTNKTLTAPIISTISNTGTVTLPTATDTLVARATTDTLTNKSISGSTNTITNVSLATGVTGTLPVANGGTGQTAATAAFNGLDPLTTKGDLVVHNGTDSIRVAVGTNDQVLTADSTQASGVKWATASGSTPDPLTTISMIDDFPTSGASAGTIGQLGWFSDAAGTGATIIRKDAESGRPGIMTLRPGTSGTGRACIGLGGDGVDTTVLGDGSTSMTWIFRSAQNLTLFEMLAIGLGDTCSSVGDQVNGVYFQLLGFPAADTNWQCVTSSASTRTRVDTGIAYSTGTWFKLKITINAAGTSVQCNINGTDVGTAIATNIPTAPISPLFKVDGIAAGTSSDSDVDFAHFSKTLTTAR